MLILVQLASLKPFFKRLFLVQPFLKGCFLKGCFWFNLLHILTFQMPNKYFTYKIKKLK